MRQKGVDQESKGGLDDDAPPIAEPVKSSDDRRLSPLALAHGPQLVRDRVHEVLLFTFTSRGHTNGSSYVHQEWIPCQRGGGIGEGMKENRLAIQQQWC